MTHRLSRRRQHLDCDREQREQPLPGVRHHGAGDGALAEGEALISRLAPLLVALALTLMFTPGPTAAADATVENVWRALREAPWGATFEEWTRRGAAASCERFRSNGGSSTADEEWAYRCRGDDADVVREWFFYIFPGAPPAPRFEQLRARIPTPVSAPPDGPEALLASRHRALAERISALYGSGEHPEPVTVREFGSASWRDIVRWRANALEIVLYMDAPPSGPSYLGLLARHIALLTAITEEWRELETSRMPPSAEWVATQLAVLLGKELHTAFPDYRALLARAVENPTDSAVQAKVYALVLELLKAAKAHNAQRPALLLAADHLASHLGSQDERSPEWDARRRALRIDGLTWHWSQLGASWFYAHDLLWRIWKEYPASPWGERAFVRLLDLGWDTSVGCRKGSDQFREVIRQGEAFLARRPMSPARAEVKFLVAQSYETWWSLSQASREDQYADPARYQDGATTARQKAIAVYKDVLGLVPTGPPSTYARRVLPRLGLGFPTNQRRFFCVYD